MNEQGRADTILLWGMMGAGKSAVARSIRDLTALNAVDLDVFIEEQEGRSVAMIIEAQGLSHFRNLERTCLTALLENESVEVIALGGGTLLDQCFRRTVREEAYVCSLLADPSVLFDRISHHDADERPLLKTGGDETELRLSALMDERRAAYLDVDFVIDTSKRTVTEVAECLIRLFGLRNAA